MRIYNESASKGNNRWSLWAWLLGCVVLLSANIYNQQWTRTGTNAVLSWDASGYYAYLPSIFYDDLGKLPKFQHVLEEYNPSGQFDQAILQPNGNYIMKYSSGQAIMYFPGFVIGHFCAKAFGYPVDGFSMPYQCAVDLWSVFFGLIGLWFIRKLLIRYFDDRVVAFALLILVLATNYFSYVARAAVLTHNYLFTLYAIMLYNIDKWHERPSYWRVALVGLVSGLAVLTRPTEIICVLLPLLWGVGNKGDLLAKKKLLLSKWSMVLIYVFSAILVGSIQLLYWKHYSGQWLVYSYGGQSFTWLRPHILNGMFSYRKGWFMYTPIMIFSLIGFVPLYRKWSKVFWATFAFSIINIYICFAWDIWWYGGSFSQRSVIQSYAVLIFPLAAFVDFVWQRKATFWAFVGISLFCAWLNLLMTYQPFMECENMTRAYYWHILGRTSIEPEAWRLLDTDELMPHRLIPTLKPFAANNLQQEPMAIPAPQMNGYRAFFVNKQHPTTSTIAFTFSPINKGWFRVRSKVFFEQKEYNQMWQAEFRIKLYHAGVLCKTRSLRIQRVTEAGQWQELYFDISVPCNDEIDRLEIVPQNQWSDKTTWLTDYRVEYTPED